VRAKVALEDVGVGENGAKMWMFENIPLHIQELNYGNLNIYELKDHVGEMALSSNLPPKLGLVNFIFFP
jgi:hypothetical protein